MSFFGTIQLGSGLATRSVLARHGLLKISTPAFRENRTKVVQGGGGGGSIDVDVSAPEPVNAEGRRKSITLEPEINIPAPH